MQKIGILGSGPVGKTLANGFLKHGYQVMIGTRDENKLAEWKAKAGEHGKTGSFSDAAKFGDIVVLATKGAVALEALKLAGMDHLKGKTVIDTTNPIGTGAPENGVIQFFTDLHSSLMEQLQAAYPETNFVKAFNSIGSPFMVNPSFESKPSMFICGNNAEAKKQVSHILDLFGFEVEDMGLVQSARAIEPLCILWCIPGFLQNKWSHAFKLLKV